MGRKNGKVQLTPERFWAKLERQDGDGCWLWPAKSRRYYGYGVLGWNGKLQSAHRVAWELANGQTLTRKDVIGHTCDNPPCCRPEHLKRMTQGDNMRDARRKGRIDPRWSNRRPLSGAVVQEARRRHAAGDTILGMSKEFNVNFATLRAAVKGVTWRHVTAA